MSSPRFTVLLVAFVAATAAPSHAQSIDADVPPAHVAYAEGDATIDRDNESDVASTGMPFVPGDRLRTERGRVEILFPDGSALDVDQNSIVELQSNVLLRLTRGRVVLVVVRRAATTTPYSIDTPFASIESDGAGEYRVSVLNGSPEPQTTLAVVRGSAVLANDQGTSELRAGERSVASDQSAPSRPESFNSARADAFYQWAASRRDDRFASSSRDHLPDDLRPYARDLERNGDWQYENSYGYVWYPSVAADWQPDPDGYWSALPTYGWTWVGLSGWSWPTHHYGRWGYGGSRWFWIPDRRWAPAWVSWGAASGYVSWCPLGFDNRPVFALAASFSAPWKGWTILPRERFIGGRNIARQFAVKPGFLSDRTSFMTLGKAPVLPPRVATRQIVGGTRGDGAARREWRDAPRDRAVQKSAPATSAGTNVPSATPKFPAGTDRFNGNRDRPARDNVPAAARSRNPVGNAGDTGVAKDDFRYGGTRTLRPDGDRRQAIPDSVAPPTADRTTRYPRRGDEFRTGTMERRADPRGPVTQPPAAPDYKVQPPPTTPNYPRGSTGGYRGYEDKRRMEPSQNAAPPERYSAPPARTAPRAEPPPTPRVESAPPPSSGKSAQPRSSGGEGKGSSQGQSHGGGSAGKGKG